MRYSRVQKTCASCGATMFVKRCVAKRAKYCSRACLGRATVRSKTANRKHPVSNSGWFTNEGSRGALNANWVECVNLRCEQCGEQFGLKPYEIRRRTIHCGSAPRFCSVKCHIAHKKTQTGPASPYWRGRNRQYRTLSISNTGSARTAVRLAAQVFTSITLSRFATPRRLSRPIATTTLLACAAIATDWLITGQNDLGSSTLSDNAIANHKPVMPPVLWSESCRADSRT